MSQRAPFVHYFVFFVLLILFNLVVSTPGCGPSGKAATMPKNDQLAKLVGKKLAACTQFRPDVVVLQFDDGSVLYLRSDYHIATDIYEPSQAKDMSAPTILPQEDQPPAR